MGFGGKWAELVLYGTVLYSCAELYPGVHLPDGLSLGVFLVQLGALDIGGFSLAQPGRQAKRDRGPVAAVRGETRSEGHVQVEPWRCATPCRWASHPGSARSCALGRV